MRDYNCPKEKYASTTGCRDWKVAQKFKQPDSELKPLVRGLIQRSIKKDGTSHCEPPREGTDGVFCDVFWRDLEPEDGVYNTELIDAAIADAKAFTDKTGQNYSVLIRIKGGVWSPDWLLASAGQITDWVRREEAKRGLDLDEDGAIDEIHPDPEPVEQS